MTTPKVTKGNLFWKYRWISFCSAHHKYNEDCPMCNMGEYKNVWETKLVSYIFCKYYKLHDFIFGHTMLIIVGLIILCIICVFI